MSSGYLVSRYWPLGFYGVEYWPVLDPGNGLAFAATSPRRYLGTKAIARPFMNAGTQPREYLGTATEPRPYLGAATRPRKYQTAETDPR